MAGCRHALAAWRSARARTRYIRYGDYGAGLHAACSLRIAALGADVGRDYSSYGYGSNRPASTRADTVGSAPGTHQLASSARE